MEHVERTGVHSVDSISVYPPYSLSEKIKEKIIEYTVKISKALHIVGLVNIQYATDGDEVYVIEVNPRASRTVPILSKVTGIPMIELAVGAMLGHKLKDTEYGTGVYREASKYAVKVPVFSGAKLINTDIALGPEMKSTGEALGIDKDLHKAFLKGFEGANIPVPKTGGVYASVKDADKNEFTAEVISKYSEAGFEIMASQGTGSFLESYGVKTRIIAPEEAEKMAGKDINILINVANVGNRKGTEGLSLRRKAIEKGITVLTCIDTANVFLDVIKLKREGVQLEYEAI